MSKNRAFVQYEKHSGRIIPGSLIVTNKIPSIGYWYEVFMDICCDPDSQFGDILGKKKAFIRYDANGNIISGSLVITEKMPKPGIWKQVYINICCNTTTTTTIISTTSSTTSTTSSTTTSTTLAPPLPPLPITIVEEESTYFIVELTSGDGNPVTFQYAIQDTITGYYVGSNSNLDSETPYYLPFQDWGQIQVGYPFYDETYNLIAIAKDPITGLTTNGVSVTLTSTVTTPYIQVRPIIKNLGTSPVGVPSAIQSFVFKCGNLDGSDVEIIGISNISPNQVIDFSFSPTGPFISSLTISGYGTDIPLTTVYYRYTPDFVGNDNADIAPYQPSIPFIGDVMNVTITGV